MVCDGPDPPENNPHELTPPSKHDLMMNGNLMEDSDDEQNEHFGYEPLPQGPDGFFSFVVEQDSDEDVQIDEEHQTPTGHVPPIEAMGAILTREVWNTQPTDSIQMDHERAQQVMSAMANFALPQASIPDWAQSISEEQWKQMLNDTIEKLRSNR